VTAPLHRSSLLALSLAIACSSTEHAPAPASPPPRPAAVAAVPDAAARPAPAATVLDAVPVATDATLARRLDAVVDHAIAAKQVVGAAVAIAIDGKLVYERYAGLADREADRPVDGRTQFRIASMTKPIVTVAALALVDRGVLSVDDPVTKWLPAFHPELADGRAPTITVRQLLTHTSGLTYTFLEVPGGPYHEAGVSDGLAEPGRSAADNLRRLASVPLLFEPGTQWHYGLSLDVLGEIIARAGGASLPEVVARLVTRPLGMTDSAFAATDPARVAWPYASGKQGPVRMTEPYDLARRGGKTTRFSPGRVFDARSYPSGGAGMVATARDYLRFAELLRTGGAPILEPATGRAMTTNQIGTIGYGRGERFGYGVRVLVDPAAKNSPKGRGTFGWGGVYGTGFFIDPEARVTFVMLTNVAGDNPLDADLEHALYEYLAAIRSRAPTQAPTPSTGR